MSKLYEFLRERSSVPLTLNVEIAREVGMDDKRQSQGSFIDNLFHGETERMESSPNGFHEKDILLFRSS